MAVGVAALAVMVLSACQSVGRAGSEPKISSSPATKTVAGVPVPVLPLDSYGVSAQQQAVLDQAVDKLAGTCMKAKGYTWPARLKRLGVARSANERRYGVTDPEAVRVYGYHLAPPVGVTAEQLAEEARQEKKRKALMTDALTKAYTGRDGATTGSSLMGGCRGEALKQLGLLRLEALTAVDLAQQQGWKRTEADSRAKAVNAKWSACMKKAGHAYADPHVAAADPAWWTKGEGDSAARKKSRAREIATAVADVKCKQQVDYVTVWQSVETTYQDKIIKVNKQELEDVRQMWRKALRKADQVLR
ncbi:hypothetical protein ACFV2H_00610 [Streptomyces sp. NPDC059629]|uniref:hypothetical protein n=1 Tax=Streptomyces sp. NPDC059629 TaxID=3346889 RepID=UPI003675D969